MIKKGLFVLVLAAFVSGGAFAQFSVGGGLMYERGGLGSMNESWNSSWQSGGMWITDRGEDELSLSQSGFGVWGFVDARFFELSVGLMRGSLTWNYEGRMTSSGGMHSYQNSWNETFSSSSTALSISLLGKLPFYLGSGIEIYPLLGIGYNSVRSVGRFLDFDRAFERGENYSSFRLLFGVGGDFDIDRNTFIRTQLLGSYRATPEIFDWMLRESWDWGGSIDGPRGGFGVTFRAAIGFRL
ncbi:MAG: hypothetical protein FWD87_04915 [Spirochaetaceae bacterium]|nr:hypothetical protein [Spirochaetaceae bacterium]